MTQPRERGERCAGQHPSYRQGDAIVCENCGRYRVEWNGVCEKCLWDQDGHNYAAITRPDEYDILGAL